MSGASPSSTALSVQRFEHNEVLGWDRMTLRPAQFVLAGVSFGAVAIGLAYVLWVFSCWIINTRRQKKSSTTIAISELTSSNDTGRIAAISTTGKEFKGKTFAPEDSFGIFLGDFDDENITDEQVTDITSCWDVLVLNPKASRLERALEVARSTFRLARFDISNVTGVRRMKRDDKNQVEINSEVNQSNTKAVFLDILNILEALGSGNKFTGIVVAGWEDYLSAGAINALIAIFKDLPIYIETNPPYFLQDSHASLQLQNAAGLIVRNGSMMPHGVRRDFFKLLNVNNSLRMACKQTMVRRDFLLAMYNPFEGNTAASNAELIRCERWCSFYGIKYWNGSEKALYNADLFVGKNKVPLAAMDYLKTKEIMDAQRMWANLEEIDTVSLNGVDRILIQKGHLSYIDLPMDDSKSVMFRLMSAETKRTSITEHASTVPTWQVQPYQTSRLGSFADMSPLGESLDGLGTFMLSEFPTHEQKEIIASAQSKLAGLKSLDRASDSERADLVRKFTRLAKAMKQGQKWASVERIALETIIRGLSIDPSTSSFQAPSVEIFRTLDTGLFIPAPDFKTNQETPCRFSGVFSRNESGKVMIFVSRASHDFELLVLHTAMAAFGISRSTCFAAEALFSQILGHRLRVPGISRRLEEEIAQLSPNEGLRVLQHLTRCPQIVASPFSDGVLKLLRRLLLVSPSSQRLKGLLSHVYLKGDISAADLVKCRIGWYAEFGAELLPDPDVATALFEEVSIAVYHALREQHSQVMEDLLQPLKAIGTRKLTMNEDIYITSLFCALRKWTLDEVILEATDRLPLFANQPDQAAVYAEMWVLGSDIESFFHCSPKQFGKVVFDKYRAQLRQDEPPLECHNGFDLFSAYQASKVDVDEEAMKKIDGSSDNAHTSFRSMAYFGVFAIPALIDVLLLTFNGKGLYISSDMGDWQSRMATLALLSALIFCGAITNFIGVGGSFYLYANTYATMINFVLKRLISGLYLVALGTLISFVTISATLGPLSGLIFGFYFLFLSTYFVCMGALCVLHWSGHPLPSGRTRVGYCLLILALNPILTSCIKGYDLAICMSVLTVFVLVLLERTLDLLAVWTMWLRVCPTPDDVAIMEWYAKKHGDGDRHSTFKGVPVPTAMEISRTKLTAETDIEVKRSFWRKPTTDTFVAELARARHLSVAILTWYSTYTKAFMPLPYTSTWNLQLKVGLNSLRSFDKGLHPHNTFILWRHAKVEVAFGLIYFVLALLDRWVELFCGGQIIGLLLLEENTTRVAIALALTVYLIAAVAMDIKVYPLYVLVQLTTSGRLTDTKMLKEAAVSDRKSRRKLYLSYFLSIFMLTLIGFGACGLLVWTFVPDDEGIEIFFAYAAGYAGLLWYQYNRVFAMNSALKPALIAIVIGFGAGVPLRLIYPDFRFADVIALNAATWSAALLTFPKTKILPVLFSGGVASIDGARSEKEEAISGDAQNQRLVKELGTVPVSRRTQISLIYSDADEKTRRAWETLRYILDDKKSVPDLDFGLPQWRNVLDAAATKWLNRSLTVIMVGRSLVSSKIACSFISNDPGTGIIVVPTDVVEYESGAQLRLLSEYDLAAVLATETAKMWFGYSQESADALSAALFPWTKLGDPSYSQASSLHHAALGLDVDTCWTSLPEPVRKFIYARCESDPKAQSILYNDPATLEWLKGYCAARELEPLAFVARSNIHPATSHARLAASSSLQGWLSGTATGTPSIRSKSIDSTNMPAKIETTYRLDLVQPRHRLSPWAWIEHLVDKVIGGTLNSIGKFIFVISTADPEFHREIHYGLRKNPLRVPIVWFLSQLFIAAKMLHSYTMDRFIRMKRPHLKPFIDASRHGYVTRVFGDRVSVEHPLEPQTGFVRIRNSNADVEQGSSTPDFRDSEVACLRIYKGHHSSMPRTDENLTAIAFYGRRQRLVRRQEFEKGNLKAEHSFEYRAETSIMPIVKRLEWSEKHANRTASLYDRHGRIATGEQTVAGVAYNFSYYYARRSDDVVKVQFACQDENVHDAPIQIEAFYGSKPRRRSDDITKWLPAKHLMRLIVKTRDGQTEETHWSYHHNAHPTLTTTVDGEVVPTPKYASEDMFKLAKPPSRTSYLEEDIVWGFKHALHGKRGRLASLFLRIMGLDSRRTKLTTWKNREALWRKWKGGFDIDAAAAVHLDEQCLRSEPLLVPYWRARDRGDIKSAVRYLKKHADAVEGAIDLAPEVGGWTFLAIKMSNLFSMGPAGDMVVNTRSTEALSVGRDNNGPSLHVLATDTGTWPTEGGGVSCCRRDMVDNLDRVKWHIIAEVANDLGMPRFQTTKNVQSVKLLAQWGLDFFTAHHGVLENYLDGQVEERIQLVSEAEIRKNFVPILKILVRGARTKKFSKTDIHEVTQMLLDLNSFFEHRDWRQVWTSDTVRQAWRHFWLSDNLGENITPATDTLSIEQPTMRELDATLDLYMRYLYIFSLKIPDSVPTVFQATHHSVGALYGILYKIKRGCTFQVWDHCVIWRESLGYLSASLCSHKPFVQNSLIAMMRIAATLNLYHADVVLPCTNYFNPGWEVELGTEEGTLGARELYRRKIDPIVNGICNMDNFEPFKEIVNKKPTVTMLSHVQYVKDIKTALLAADVIINEWKFDDYQLEIYGGLDRAPSYTVECQELLASKGLHGRVLFHGYGNPKAVLQKTWLFMNSSISEGLPLAIGEAALTGAPIVCTDVGATKLVLQDPDDAEKLYGEVILPNRPRDLARAQIEMLAVCGKWSTFATDNGGEFVRGLPDRPTSDQVAQVQQRMYDQYESRRALGLNMRNTVLRKFDGDRYLREHEQMLWVGQQVHYTRQRLYNAQGERQVQANMRNLEHNMRRVGRPAMTRGFSALSSSGQSRSAGTS
ncbi:hypothetical protein diail_4710, partial [Diaporthe ilicicola]